MNTTINPNNNPQPKYNHNNHHKTNHHINDNLKLNVNRTSRPITAHHTSINPHKSPTTSETNTNKSKDLSQA